MTQATTREQRIIEAFVGLTASLTEDFDVVDLLHELAERAVELLDCSEVGLLVVDVAGALRVMASSSERSAALELLQSQNSEGPCFDAVHTGAQVASADIGSESGRWPTFAPAALAQGFLSVQAIPMRARGTTIGALNLFRVTRGSLADEDVPLAQGMADVAAVAILQERSLRDAQHTVAQLQSALNSRVAIEQAKGVLAEKAQIGVDDAFVVIRDHARRANRRLGDVAADVIAGRIDADALRNGDRATRDAGA